ncbi:substrate-binding domain-containing protein [Polynucleobacter brandtiae]|uniref:Molybdate transport repressor ModE-like protein n=1 Tax=Polynucleobacter brandtiae TaxID=1938816 RepID=A0A2M8VXQ6_9BURK|nr:substrate-binding domain-containing protein [Polynucleobacter brandtiae]PJI82635.1 molybdate transport repressor ModE-like protein [Polynucleobacter brandtiae]
MRIKIKPSISLISTVGGKPSSIDLAWVIELLSGIKEGKSMTIAAQSAGISYRTIWNHLKLAEKELGIALLDSVKGHGSKLSAAGELLLGSTKQLEDRFSALFPSEAIKLQEQLMTITNQLNSKWKIAASSDPIIEKLISKSANFELRTMGSGQSLESLIAGKSDIAGFHVPDEGSIKAIYLELKQQGIDAIPVMKREQGLIVAKGNPHKIKTIRDLARPEVRFINRQKGAGTRLMLDNLLEAQGIASKQIKGYQHEEFTHSAVATAILANIADAGLGLHHVAKEYKLHFIPLNIETFFLAMPTGLAKQSAVAALIKNIRNHAGDTIGYSQLKLRNRYKP